MDGWPLSWWNTNCMSQPVHRRLARLNLASLCSALHRSCLSWYDLEGLSNLTRAIIQLRGWALDKTTFSLQTPTRDKNWKHAFFITALINSLRKRLLQSIRSEVVMSIIINTIPLPGNLDVNLISHLHWRIMAVCLQAVSKQPEDQNQWCTPNMWISHGANTDLHQNLEIPSELASESIVKNNRFYSYVEGKRVHNSKGNSKKEEQ